MHCRVCYEHGSELMHIENEGMDNFTTKVLDGMYTRLGNPVLPTYYHLGIYQNQESNQYYVSNGQNV